VVPPPIPRQYQVRIESCKSYEIAARGNELGVVGWELVGVIQDGAEVLAIFKKERLPR
jgi:hypothetical protein